MRVVPVGSMGRKPRTRRFLSIVGTLAGATLLMVLLTTAAAAADSTTTPVPASTTSTAAAGTAAPGPVATPASAAPSATGIVPPILGSALLNPGWKTAQMAVQVWPEYDQAAVLVIMNFEIPADVPLPATFKFAVPTGASIAGIGEVDANNNFTFNYAKTYPPVQAGTDWDIVTIQVQKYRALQIDYYYDPGLPAGAGLRSFPMLLELPMDVGALNLHVQQPTRATDFKVQPAMQGTGVAQDGFTYAVASFSDIKAGSTLGYVVSYNKPDATPSATADQTQTPSNKLNTSTVLIGAIAVIVIVLGGAIIYLLYKRGGKGAPAKKGTQAKQKPRPGRSGVEPISAKASAAGKAKKPQVQAKSTPKGDTENEADGAAVGEVGGGRTDTPAAAEVTGHCLACGEDLIKNARFCPNCGEAQGR